MAFRVPRTHAYICHRCLLHPRKPNRRLFTTTPPVRSEQLDLDPPLPPTAPKPSINLKAIRSAPAYHAQNCINRNYPGLAAAPEKIVSLYEEWTALQRSLRTARERHNTLSGRLRSASPLKQDPDGGEGKEATGEETREILLAEAKELKTKITEVEAREGELENQMKNLAILLPNTTSEETPIGGGPKVLGYINENLIPQEGVVGKSHTQIGSELGLIDFSSASTVSGWGWYYLTNEAVLLEQALINYALSLAASKGWKLVTPPSIVYSHIAAACGFRPRDQNGEQQIYTLEEGEGKLKHALAGTAEIPLAGMGVNRTFMEDELPLKMCGVSRAYRAEAGARGADSKGLYRVHEFTKVELFAWTLPDAPIALPVDPVVTEDEQQSESASTSKSFTQNLPKAPNSSALFSEILSFQTTFLTSLGLPARILEMPSTDLGASAARKVDVEVYMPSRAAKDPWGEVSSASNCTDYQSRRLNTRVKVGGKGAKTEFPFTLNGTAVAVPRVLMAILENGWTEERGGGVVVPEVLRSWMGGLEWIGRKRS